MKCIEIIGAKQNNLKSIHLKIPLGLLTVVCGPSGSGKSSLAFETLFAEGYRHYTQTLSHYARQYTQQLPRPMVSHIHNIPPALALEQKNRIRSWRPTVGTFTELAACLRLIFTYMGEVLCPVHQQPLVSFSPSQAVKKIVQTFKHKKGFVLVPLTMEADVRYSSRQKNQRVMAKKMQLLKDGFRYIYHSEKPAASIRYHLQEINQIKTWPKGQVYLVVDQLAFENHVQLADSLKTAQRAVETYHPSRALLRIVSTTGENLYISCRQSCCPVCAYQFPFTIQSSFFNFNESLGACAECRGFGNHFVLDENKIVRSPWKSLAAGAIEPFTMPSATAELRSLRQFCRLQKIDWHSPWETLSKKQKKKIWEGDTRFIGVQGYFNYLETKKYKLPVRVFLSRYKTPKICEECQGKRFRKEVSYITFKGFTLPEMLDRDIQSLFNFFQKIKFSVLERKKIPEVIRKIRFLLETLNTIGLGYLNLNRAARTLSSGELQRLSLAHQLGLGLSQTLYVLDEPTVGLHPSDTACLSAVLQKLKTLGNTLVVVEHDPDMIKSADFIVELGPGSGENGGKVVFSGSKEQFLKSKSLTSSYLTKNPLSNSKLSNAIHLAKTRRPVAIKEYKYFLEIEGCQTYNLKNVHLRLPLNRLVCMTGPSGSGKSTLVTYTLYPALARAINKKMLPGGIYSTLKGASYLRRIVLVNTSPIEKTRRSLPVTYLKIYDSIRQLIARSCPLSPRDFSLNVDGGRCSVCRGLGYQEVEMVFMDPVRILCEECQGKRFQPKVLKAQWKGKNIYQILNMNVQQALDFFVSYPAIWRPLAFLKKVGMDYLVLGQSLSTLSGGESQRLKLVRELIHADDSPCLYILDEPTVGLHFREVQLLMKLLHNLVEKGNSVLLIEHNLEALTRSDYLIDMGPGAGPEGGRIVAQGSLPELMTAGQGKTSLYLKTAFFK